MCESRDGDGIRGNAGGLFFSRASFSFVHPVSNSVMLDGGNVGDSWNPKKSVLVYHGHSEAIDLKSKGFVFA